MSEVEHTIIIEPGKCTGCRRCQLICSFLHSGNFSLYKAYVIIDENDYGVTDITFTDDCVECNICVQYCAYDALKVREKG
jgi:carbon-monoxide dehydrogenase iron sulfur subunit